MERLTPCLLVAKLATLALGCNMPRHVEHALRGQQAMSADAIAQTSASNTISFGTSEWGKPPPSASNGRELSAVGEPLSYAETPIFPDDLGAINETVGHPPDTSERDHPVEAAKAEMSLDPSHMDDETLRKEIERTRFVLSSLLERTGLNPDEHPELDRSLDNPDFLPSTDLLRRRYEILRAIPQHSPSDGWISSTYGERTVPGESRQHFHKGIDIAAHTGTLVYAPGDGIVRFAGRYGSYGKFVSIVHGYGIVTKFAHNNRLLVRAGDRVKTGDPIAQVGDTGKSRGMHLHYEVWVNDRSTDPLGFMPPIPGLSDDPERLVATSGEP